MAERESGAAVPQLIRRLLFVCLLACAPVLAGIDRAHGDLPAPRGAVNDFAGVLSSGSTARMQALAAELLDKTDTAVVVAVFSSLDGQDPDQFANELYEAWGIGTKGVDRGVLILLALDERRVRIETGFGVEGILPDGLVGSILDRWVVPELRQNNFDQGLFNAMSAVGQVLARDANVEITGALRPASPQHRSADAQTPSPFAGLILLVMLALMMCTRTGRRMLPLLLIIALSGGRGGFSGGRGGGFSGGFGGFGGGLSGGGGAGRGF